jgi:hypothetical protein
MKKHNRILKLSIGLSMISVILLISSSLFWIGNWENNKLVKYVFRKTEYPFDLLALNSENSLVFNFLYRQNITQDQIEKFFTLDSICYLQQIPLNDKEFLFYKSQTKDTIKSQYDEVLQLKSTFAYFVFNNKKIVKILVGGNTFEGFNYDYYFKSHGIFQTYD